MDKFSKALGVIVIILVIFMVGLVVEGKVIQVLWKWFVVDYFNVEELSLRTALGFSTLVCLFTSHLKSAVADDDNKKEYAEIFGRAVARSIVLPLIFLAYGYFVYSVF